MNLPLGSDAVCRMSRECAYSYEKWKQTIFLTKKNISYQLWKKIWTHSITKRNRWLWYNQKYNRCSNNTCVAFTNYNIYFVGMYYLKYYILIIYTKWLGPLALYITNDHRDGSQPKHVRVWVRVERIGSSPRFGFLCGTCSSNVSLIEQWNSIFHSSQFQSLCSTKSSIKALQNLPYFMHTNPQSCFFRFSFHATLFFSLMNALVYVNIDLGIH